MRYDRDAESFRGFAAAAPLKAEARMAIFHWLPQVGTISRRFRGFAAAAPLKEARRLRIPSLPAESVRSNAQTWRPPGFPRLRSRGSIEGTVIGYSLLAR